MLKVAEEEAQDEEEVVVVLLCACFWVVGGVGWCDGLRVDNGGG
jgi:hypothetical protein